MTQLKTDKTVFFLFLISILTGLIYLLNRSYFSNAFGTLENVIYHGKEGHQSQIHTGQLMKSENSENQEVQKLEEPVNYENHGEQQPKEPEENSKFIIG